MKPLNIAILDFDDIQNPLLNAGQARATFEVAKRLVQHGHAVTVYCSRYPGYRDRTQDGIIYKHFGLGSRNIKLNNIVYFFALPLQVLQIRADIILESFVAPIATCFSPLFTSVPVVGLPTIFEAEEFSRKYHMPFHWVTRFGAKFYKYFLPYTEAIATKMKSYNSKVIFRVVPQGVGEEYFDIPKKTPRYILYLGRLDMDQKGLDLLLNAYAKIAHKIAWPLVIAGGGPDKELVAAKISELGLENRVRMVGPTYGDKKKEVLAEALYVAFPSRYEGFSLFSLEALASGLPLVGFDIPALSWAGPEVAKKAEAFNVEEYARLLLESCEYAADGKWGKSCREVAKNYTWSKVVDGFENFFYEIIEKENTHA